MHFFKVQLVVIYNSGNCGASHKVAVKRFFSDTIHVPEQWNCLFGCEIVADSALFRPPAISTLPPNSFISDRSCITIWGKRTQLCSSQSRWCAAFCALIELNHVLNVLCLFSVFLTFRNDADAKSAVMHFTTASYFWYKFCVFCECFLELF